MCNWENVKRMRKQFLQHDERGRWLFFPWAKHLLNAKETYYGLWSQESMMSAFATTPPVIYRSYHSLWTLMKSHHTHTLQTGFSLPFTEEKQGSKCLKGYLKLQSWDLNPVSKASGPERKGTHVVSLTVDSADILWSRKWSPATLRGRSKLGAQGWSRGPRAGTRDPDVWRRPVYLASLTTALFLPYLPC